MADLEFDPAAYIGPDSPIGPRMALSLWCAARDIVERAEVDPTSIEAGLPPAAAAWGSVPQWQANLLGCYRMVRERLAIGAMPLARCTGEEFALHITISVAAMAEASGYGPTPEEHGLQLIPEPGDDDYAEAHESLFVDHELLLLFDPVLDGIEDPSSSVNRRLGIGPWLHPSNWFEPFAAYLDVDPLASAPGAEVVEDDVLVAASDLAMRTGARRFDIHPTRGSWEARATYRGTEVVACGDDPQSAATSLVRQIIEGERCPSCAHIITIDPGSPADQRCHWHRSGPRWDRGCEEASHV